MRHTTRDLQTHFVQFVYATFASTQLVVRTLQLAGILIEFVIALTEDLANGTERNVANDFVDDISGLSLVRCLELVVSRCVCLNGIGENLSKQIELPHELVQTITLAPAPLPVFPGITFNGNLCDIQVLVLQRHTDFFKYGWKVVSQAPAESQLAMCGRASTTPRPEAITSCR